MPGIDILKTSVAAGAGVVDEVAEWWDQSQGRTESFRTATDLSRLGLAAAGYLLQIFMPKQARIGEALALSETPLLIKSIAKPIKAAMGMGTTAQKTFVPRRRAPAPIPASMPAAVETPIQSEEPVITSVT